MGECGLHPLIHTLLVLTLAQDVDYGQRFPGLGSEPPQTGHTFSVGLTIRLAFALRAFDSMEFDSFYFHRKVISRRIFLLLIGMTPFGVERD
jgi:hypothetical protein